MRTTIGIDTGGTYTDAVVFAPETGAILASAKALTTRGDLAIGISEALQAVVSEAGAAFSASGLQRVVLSTTLATNALVEGHGSSVTSILVGFDERMAARTEIARAIPTAHLVHLAGGHRYTGDEQTPLDETGLARLLEGPEGQSAAFAVTANYAVRNPAHEHRVKALIRARTGRPVTASSELSAALNGPRRALTATFNARIVGLIVALVDAVEASLRDLDIAAPILIVRGDGTIARAETVVEKPIETILSGPAASVIGARFLCSLDDFIVSDIGGTTTDIATVRNGWPSLNEAGASVGGFRTLVRAVDMTTMGLGGDSELLIATDGTVTPGQQRVVPLSLAARRFPQIGAELLNALGQGSGMLSATRYLLLPPGEHGWPADLGDADIRFLEALKARTPVLYGALVMRAADRSRVARLIKRGLVQITGLTPSDAAHVLGLQSQWDANAARHAAELCGRATGWVTSQDAAAEVQRFARAVVDSVVTASSRLILNRLTGLEDAGASPLLEALARGEPVMGDLGMQAVSNLPLIAVGGPAPVYYPEVGTRVGAQTVVPDKAGVANAVGAAVGVINARAQVEITYNEGGGYLVHGDSAPDFHQQAADALTAAEDLARTRAETAAWSMGAGQTQTRVDVKRIDIPNLSSEFSLMAATITAECTGEAAGKDASH